MNGIIIINKPKGITSHDVVQKVKKICNEKVGHTGTLDPMATGVLPLLIGKGTLCSKYLINHDKKYRVTLELGKKTDTADAEGNVIEEQKVDTMQEEKVKEVLQNFIGKQEQIPPMYSAIKVKGKKLYEYARKGIKVEVKPRKIEIYEIKLIKINEKEKQIQFEVSCSKGTYIRSLCEDIADKLGTVGYMVELERLQVGEFSLSQAITIEELEKTKKIQYITIDDLFNKKEIIELNEKQYKHFLNGVQLTKKSNDGIYRIYYNKQFVAIGVIKNELLKRDIVL